MGNNNQKYKKLANQGNGSTAYEHKLYVIKKAITYILRYIPREIPKFTDHGYEHSKRIIGYLNDVIDIYQESGGELNEKEIFILYASAWIHDIGNLEDRESHAEKSCEMWDTLKRQNYLFDLDNPVESGLKTVVKRHRSEEELDDIPERTHSCGDEIKVQLLATLFRIADSCDIDNRRAPEVVYDILQEELDEEIWKGHMNIESVLVREGGKILVIVHEEEVSGKQIEELREEIEKVNSVLEDCENIEPFSIEVKAQDYFEERRDS